MTKDTMKEVRHTSRDTQNTFDEVFRQGPDTAADSGRETENRMREVEHAADETSVEHVWARGNKEGHK